MPDGYHEPVEDLSVETKDLHRAVMSLKEELEAMDWYNHRIDVCKNKELKSILVHNRDEEKEHAAMLIEWVRRNDEEFNEALEKFLFTEKSIVKD